MNLDELARRIRAISAEPVVEGLADLLLHWKTDDSTAVELRDNVERYLGNSWVENDEDYRKLYRLWSLFREQVIARIGGITMNERLYWFGLLERFDASLSDEERRAIYRKLHGSP
jgi:hypothetical protein